MLEAGSGTLAMPYTDPKSALGSRTGTAASKEIKEQPGNYHNRNSNPDPVQPFARSAARIGARRRS
jgi:hypothetical protein